MRINNNIMAMNTHRQYAINNSNVSKSTERLSSGYKINRAGDDAAGLAISEKMRAQIRGLNMASKNSEDAISLVQTAEGALTETHAILQRMRELAVQSSSDTNDSEVVDREALNEEFQALKSEINDIANKTAFNGKKLLNGDFASATSSTTHIAATVGVTVAPTMDAGTSTLTVTQSTAAVAAHQVAFDSASTGTSTMVTGIAEHTAATVTGAAANGTYTIRAAANGSNVDYTLLNSDGETVASATNVAIADTTTVDFGAAYGSYDLDFDVDPSAPAAADVATEFTNVNFTITFDSGTDAQAATISVASTNGTATFTSASSTAEIEPGITLDLSGIDWSTITDTELTAETALFGDGNNSGTISITAAKGMIIQTGANASDELEVTIDNMSSNALSLDSYSQASINAVVAEGKTVTTAAGTAIDLKTQEHASVAIQSVNNAINTVSTQRSKLGAYQNRLEHKINNLDASSENLAAAESRIRDVDMAQEMTKFTTQNILVQAATAMLAQANSAPQNVLSLLK